MKHSQQRSCAIMPQIAASLTLAMFALTSSIMAQDANSETATWQGMLPARLAEFEYHFSPLGGGVWSAPNRAHGLRSRLTPTGLQLCSRELGEAWSLSLQSVVFGRRGERHALAPVEPRIAGPRAELEHGLLTEWFVNDEQGVEQGWTIKGRVQGQGELLIELAIESNLQLGLSADGQLASFQDSEGRTRLTYSGLLARDALGKALAVKMTKSQTGLVLHVDDRGAAYPILVDPYFMDPDWTSESNQTNAIYGISVAGAGDVNGDGFDDVIIGASNFDAGEAGEGRAFLFHGSASGLANSAAWTAESDQVDAAFGASVAGAGDVNGDGFSDVVVGAPNFDVGQFDEGRAYVYLGSASGLASTPAWIAEPDKMQAAFGASVASAGDINGDGFDDLIIGSPNFINPLFLLVDGLAYVYHGSPSGPSSSPDWSLRVGRADSRFGNSVASAGDVNQDGFDDVIIGAVEHNSVLAPDGAAFVFHGSASGLGATQDWMGEIGGFIFSDYGRSVAGAGDVNGDGFSDVIVGAPEFSLGLSSRGGVYVYHGSLSGLNTSPDWVSVGGQAGERFGFAVASAGDMNGDGFSDVAIGAPWHSNTQPTEGRASVFFGSALGLDSDPVALAESGQNDAELGTSLAGAGDLNGDGWDDLIVGAPFFDNPETNEGGVFVYHGLPTPSASGFFYNGSGFNTICMNSVPPVIGEDWVSQIDTSVHPGASFSLFAVRAFPSSGFFIFGGELLVDITSSLLLSIIAPVSGSSTSFSFAVPPSIAFAGLSAAAQGFIFGSGSRTLCNGYLFTVGF